PVRGGRGARAGMSRRVDGDAHAGDAAVGDRARPASPRRTDAMNAPVPSTPRPRTHTEVDMLTPRHSRSVRLRALAALLGALAALLLVAGVGPAQASHIFCGAVLGPGTHVLESDLGPCPVGVPALTLNSAVLILNEFTVR